MKSTLRNVFHSPRFLVGFIIFMVMLLTVLIYPYLVSRDPLVSLGKGFLAPGTYVSVYDANNTDPYRVTLPEADLNRKESLLSKDDRQTMLDYLKAKGTDISNVDTSNEKLEDLIAVWSAEYSDEDARKNKYEGFSTQAKRNALRRLNAKVTGNGTSTVMSIVRGEGEDLRTRQFFSLPDPDAGKFRHAGNVFVVVDHQHAFRIEAQRRVHAGDLHNHGADASVCARRVMVQHGLVYKAAVRLAHAHRRHNDAVSQGDASDIDRGKQMRIFGVHDRSLLVMFSV